MLTRVNGRAGQNSSPVGILEETIDPGRQTMHQKYLVRDHATADAAVLIGSANFTTDSWAVQDSNILVITGASTLADGYERDFADLWAARKLAGTGVGHVAKSTSTPPRSIVRSLREKAPRPKRPPRR